MAWLQVHQSLPTHRKTLAAADALDIAPIEMVGHLVSFWLWALDNATDGHLEGVSDRTLARAASWTGDPGAFVATLREVRFLDSSQDALTIHDWDQYTGRLSEKRRLNAERQQRYRQAHQQESNASVTRYECVTSQGRVEKSRVEKSRGDTHVAPAAAVALASLTHPLALPTLETPSATVESNGTKRKAEPPAAEPLPKARAPAHAEQWRAIVQGFGYDAEAVKKSRGLLGSCNAAARTCDELGLDFDDTLYVCEEVRKKYPKATPAAVEKYAATFVHDS